MSGQSVRMLAEGISELGTKRDRLFCDKEISLMSRQVPWIKHMLTVGRAAIGMVFVRGDSPRSQKWWPKYEMTNTCNPEQDSSRGGAFSMSAASQHER